LRPLFIATKKFDPIASPADWQTFVAGSELTHITEVVSLDSLLCPPLLEETKPEYWPYIVNEDFMGQFFTDLNYLLAQVANVSSKNILCVYREPTTTPTPPHPKAWEFMGYDLVDTMCGVSALTNCGGFPRAFAETELSARGLLGSLTRAREVQQKLRVEYSDEPHAHCHVWAIFRSAA
jgi:hypothetical protein